MTKSNVLKTVTTGDLEGEITMAMRQGLGQQQNQIQKLAMTQRMQQSIRMLKFSADELQSFLKQEELENPFLVLDPRGPGVTSNFVSTAKAVSSEADWTQFTASRKKRSLFDYLLDQIHLTMRKTPLRGWVIFLIDHMDSNGYLDIDLDELLASNDLIDKTTLFDAVTLVQSLDPPGVGTRDLQECLILQVQNDMGAPVYTEKILQNDFGNFVDHNWKILAKKYAVPLSDIQEILNYVRTLSPAPGAEYSQEDIGYVRPDLILKRNAANQLELSVTKQTRPKVVFKDKYFQEMINSSDVQVKKYAKQKQKEFATIIKDIKQRGATLLRVGNKILEYQKKFFLDSSQPLVPLLLRNVANDLHLHESTISRAVNGKYLQTDNGIYELKSFFSQAVNYSNSGEVLTAADVKARIKAEIIAEDKQKPFSDQKISQMLSQEGLKLSRRTVAKYRQQLNIPSSSQRKNYL